MEIINKKTGKRSMERDKKINKKLKKENERLKQVNNILSKAAAFFSQDHLK